MSLTDIMTALMVIFMFIAISYMVEINKQKTEIEKIVSGYEDIKKEMADELEILVKKDLKKWKKNIEFNRATLSISFTGKNIQFRPDSDRIRTKFLLILKEFIPKYLSIISKEKYKEKIAEIRIEGHANKPIVKHKRKKAVYMKGIEWSQRRAKKVLKYTISTKEFKSYGSKTRDRLEFWFVANGYGFGRTLDKKKQYTINSKNKICPDCSRRVEFRIITTSEQIVEEILTKIN